MQDKKKLELIENSIIPIYEDRSVKGKLGNGQLVSARELWERLESKRRFADWIKDRITKYGFIEDVDYVLFHKFVKRGVGNLGDNIIEYILTLDTAKEIAMVENNEVGRNIRKYLIEVEKRYRELVMTRAKAKIERRVLTDIIKELVPESPHKKWMYRNYTDLVYKIVIGFTAKEYRCLHGLKDDANLRDYLDERIIKEVQKYERIIQGLLSLGLGYEEIKQVLTKPFVITYKEIE